MSLWSEPDAHPGPLAGIRVVDLSRQAPGPYASMLLGDLGADVVLVEAPAGTFATRAVDAAERERRRAHSPIGRNKRSIVVDLKQAAGREIVHALARDADVFLEGFRPGVVDALGVGYEQIAQTNERIVYASLSGYGQTGPYRTLVGHDINYISVGGGLSMMRRPGQGMPAIPQNILGDVAGGGLMTAFAITSALLARARTGRGQYLDMSMSDGVLYLFASQTAGVLSGITRAPADRILEGALPHYNTYECADGKYLTIGSLEPRFWATLCHAVGRDDLEDAEYDSDRHAEFAEYLTRFFKQRTRDEWFEAWRDLEICVAPVLELDEALANEHQLARDMVIEVDDPNVGRVRQVGIAPKFSDTPGAVQTTAAAAGQHTDHILEALGHAPEAIARLREQGVVA